METLAHFFFVLPQLDPIRVCGGSSPTSRSSSTLSTSGEKGEKKKKRERRREGGGARVCVLGGHKPPEPPSGVLPSPSVSGKSCRRILLLLCGGVLRKGVTCGRCGISGGGGVGVVGCGVYNVMGALSSF